MSAKTPGARAAHKLGMWLAREPGAERPTDEEIKLAEREIKGLFGLPKPAARRPWPPGKAPR